MYMEYHMCKVTFPINFSLSICSITHNLKYKTNTPFSDQMSDFLKA